MEHTTQCPKCNSDNVIIVKTILICNSCGYSTQYVVEVVNKDLDDLIRQLEEENKKMWDKLDDKS